MKTSIKLWLSGQDAERERHYSATKGMLFYKGEAIAIRYYSRVTKKHHIIVNNDAHIPAVDRLGYSVNDIFSLIHISRMHTGSYMNDDALHQLGIPPSNFSVGMFGIPQEFDSLIVGALRLSDLRYFVITKEELDPNLGINNAVLVKKQVRYAFASSEKIYAMSDPVDFTLASVSNSLFRFDRETATLEYLEQLSQKKAYQRKLSTRE